MRIIADLHIHSHYSLATSKDLIPESLDYWARRKGITVVATGDSSHPGWLSELEHKLEPKEEGLFKLKDSFRKQETKSDPIASQQTVRFLLSAELSCVYKKKGKTRKIHVLLYAPSFHIFRTLQNALQARGKNITSDGRPILGMDVRDLFELCLTISPDIILVPAHIWTPWFSVLGAYSGFDTIEECFDDLSPHIFAVETGLSSDPPMNWLCSFLDRYTLISNSDAHSPEKLGREATIIDTDLSYTGIMSALKTRKKNQYLGTIEFFPEEGKYHYDGHRVCGISWNPLETRRHNKICSQCNKEVTVGVLHRVAELSDRSSLETCPTRAPFYSVVPLKELIAACVGKKSGAKCVVTEYNRILSHATEFDILLQWSKKTIASHTTPELAEAIDHMRKRTLVISEGFDGEFGTISLPRNCDSLSPRPLVSFDIASYRLASSPVQ